MSRTLNLVFSAFAIVIAVVWIRYQKALKRVHHLPGTRLLPDPFSMFSLTLPRVKGLSIGFNYIWDLKYSLYDGCRWDIHAFVGAVQGTHGYIVSSLDVIKQMVNSRDVFIKPLEEYGTLDVFGPNILVSEGEQWKRYRRICAPAFAEKNNNFVWNIATEIADEMIGIWASGGSINIHDVCKEITQPFALCVIANAGFGQDATWKDNAPAPSNHQLTFKRALGTVVDNIFLTLLLPRWAWTMRKHWRFVRNAYTELMTYLHKIIESRRNPSEQTTVNTAEKYDLLSLLLCAHDTNEELTSEELIGNVFLFLIAGYDTTSHTLAFMLGLLALYPEEQAKVLQDIMKSRPESGRFSYDDIHKLTYVGATINETLRLYPPVTAIPKKPSKDTVLNLGSGQTIGVPAGTRVLIHVPGVHYNPRYWDEPFEFLPSRFIDRKWSRDAFIPFSVGHRACIGRRFAEATLIAFVAHILPRYHISVDEERFQPIAGESMVERRERFMNAKDMLTLGPKKLRLVFTPRA